MSKRRSILTVVRMITFLLLTCLMLVGIGNSGSAVAGAPTPSAKSASSTLVLRLYYRDRAQYIMLAMEFGLEEAQSPRGYLLMPADQAMLDSLRARGLRVEVDWVETQKAIANPPIFGHNAYTFYGGYYTVEEMQTFLDQKISQYPTLAQKVDYGDSWCKTHPGLCTQPNAYNGYDLWAMRITNQAIPGPKPVFWYTGGLHSRELAPPELAIRYINWLLDNYNTNADARWLVDYHDIWVVPMHNPDGHHIVEAGGGGNSPYSQRKNASNTNGCTVWPPTGGSQFGTDLNRNFPFMWSCCGGSSGTPCNLTYRGPAQDSESETQAITDKLRTLIPDQRGPNIDDPAPITATGLYMDMHSNATQNLYPWGQDADPAPNNDDLRNIAKHMSAPAAGGNNYQAAQSSTGLYFTDGASDDWEYGELGAPGFTIELSGSGFFPPYSTIDSIWNLNRNTLIYLAKISRQPYLTNRGPDANLVASNPMTVTQGTSSMLGGTINFVWSANTPQGNEQNTYLQNVAAAEYYIDTPPWAGGTPLTMTAVDGTYDSPTEEVQAIVNTESLTPGRHVLLVRGRGVNDYEGYQSWGAISATFLDVLPDGGNTATPTATAVPPTTTTTTTATSTATHTTTPVPPTATTPPCDIYFDDVPPGHVFYPFIHCLFCRNVVSGYADGTFRPNAQVTRGQLAKIVSNSAGFSEAVSGQTFEDVTPGHTFYIWIERLTSRGYMTGYACGGPGEPCVNGRPYFRPQANATRGQTAKIVSNAAGFTEPPVGQTFEDVPLNHTFYEFIQRLASRNVMGGYDCGGPGEPCISGKPYFRPGNDVTRGQSAKIVANTFFPGCTR